jgi:hypothetical protein
MLEGAGNGARPAQVATAGHNHYHYSTLYYHTTAQISATIPHRTALHATR